MSYIGYSNEISTFVKILVDEFGNEYEGDSYLTYYDNINMFLSGKISSDELINFFEDSNFCVFELDHLIKNVNNLIEKDILYKQKLNKFVTENIDVESLNNTDICIKALSLLFDDFIDTYNENIFDYESFYIPFLGIYLSLSQEKFMEFIMGILKENSLIAYDFYFMVNFLRDFVDFKYLNKYVKEFILYSQEYIDSSDDSIESIPILMFVTFKINKIMVNLTKGYDFSFFNKDKALVLATLKLFTRYFKEYNLLFIDKIDEENKNFVDNKEVVYMLLKHLTNFPINDEDCKTILMSYGDLMFDYLKYEGIKKITDVVKYLVSPVMKNYKINEIVNSNGEDDVINTLTFCFLIDGDYVALYIDRCRNFGFNKQIGLHVLKLILIEEQGEIKKEFLIRFVRSFNRNIIEDFNYGDENLFNYILWITNDVIVCTTNVQGMNIVLNLLRKKTKLVNLPMYNLVNNLLEKFDYKPSYFFEGKSFYNHLVNTEDKVFYNRMDKEYFYAKHILFQEHNEEILIEKQMILNFLKIYFEDINYLNKNNYYKFLIESVYFDIYKFEVLDFILSLNIEESILKDECDFLIYKSPHEQGVMLGILFSLALKNNYYDEDYKKIFSKVTWGDIFSKLYEKFKIKELSSNLNHKSFIFKLKYELESLYGSKKIFDGEETNLHELILKKINDFNGNANLFYYLYIFVFSDVNETDVNVNTIKLKTSIELIKNDFDNKIICDKHFYDLFMSCFEIYIKSFISFTQFEILEDIYVALENKFLNFRSDLQFKEIEFNNEIEDKTNRNLKSNYANILKKINKAMKSPQADEYYDNLFISENLDLISVILNNENKFYNETISLFHSYLNGSSLLVLEDIYKKCNKNIFIAKVFIKLMANYPEVLLNTLKDVDKFNIYIKILENSF